MYNLKIDFVRQPKIVAGEPVISPESITLGETQLVNFILSSDPILGHEIYLLEIKEFNTEYIEEIQDLHDHYFTIHVETDTSDGIKKQKLFLLPFKMEEVEIGQEFGHIKLYCVSKLIDAMKNDYGLKIDELPENQTSSQLIDHISQYVIENYGITFNRSTENVSNYQYDFFSINKLSLFDILKFIYKYYPPFLIKVDWFITEFNFGNPMFIELNVSEFETLPVFPVKMGVEEPIRLLGEYLYFKDFDLETKNFVFIDFELLISFEDDALEATKIEATNKKLVYPKDGELIEREVEDIETVNIEANYSFEHFKERLEKAKELNSKNYIIKKYRWSNLVKHNQCYIFVPEGHTPNQKKHPKLMPLTIKSTFKRLGSGFYIESEFESLSLNVNK